MSVARVEVAVARRTGRKFEVLKAGKFLRGKTVKIASSTFNRASLKGKAWSYKIPRSWKAGPYIFRVRAVDTAGNVSSVATRSVKLK